MTHLFQQLTACVGRLADDPAVVAFVGETLGQKLPPPTNDVNHTKHVTARKFGLELAFSHDIRNDRYPLVAKSKKTFVPYLAVAWLGDQFPDPPFGLRPGLPADEIARRLGADPAPRGSGRYRHAWWRRALDAERDVVLDVDEKTVAVCVAQARELSGRFGVPPRPVVGAFVGWAARRGLLDPTRAGEHAALVDGVRSGARRGGELLAAAWPRGLWDVHLTDRPGLRDFAYRWFHNIEVGFIRDDFVTVFGGREGPTGHTEPALDDDSADAVDRVSPVLDARFAAWLG